MKFTSADIVASVDSANQMVNNPTFTSDRVVWRTNTQRMSCTYDTDWSSDYLSENDNDFAALNIVLGQIPLFTFAHYLELIKLFQIEEERNDDYYTRSTYRVVSIPVPVLIEFLRANGYVE